VECGMRNAATVTKAFGVERTLDATLSGGYSRHTVTTRMNIGLLNRGAVTKPSRVVAKPLFWEGLKFKV
jgi:hypothetical protein